MTTNIEISNITKHYSQNLHKNDKTLENTSYKTKIVKLSFYSKNEAVICDKIRNIPYYYNNFIIIEDYDFINISQLNGNSIEKLIVNTSQNEQKYLVFRYNNHKILHFNDFLFNLHDHKQLFFHSIDSFSYILKSFIKLDDINICFFDFSPQNVVFNFDCGEKPQLRNFQKSLQINTLNEKYISNIIKKVSDFTHKPLEVHVLFYLIQNDISTISHQFIEEICNVFVNNLSILSLFSDKYKNSYLVSCIESLKKYINMARSDIISDILSQVKKWDIYSLSVLYLHIFGNISRFFTLKSTFINKITVELSKNIHPDPSKRNNFKNLYEKYEKLFSEEKEWFYVNKLKCSTINDFFTFLGN